MDEAQGRQAVDLASALASFDDLWAPRRVARLNDYDVRVVKVHGEFTWHDHPDTDELFLVLSGALVVAQRAGDVTWETAVRPGQLYVVPRGLEHCPRAETLTTLVLLEPSDVVNTGTAGGPQTSPVRDL